MRSERVPGGTTSGSRPSAAPGEAANGDLAALLFPWARTAAVLAIGVLADKLGSASPGFAGIPTRDEVRLRRPAC